MIVGVWETKHFGRSIRNRTETRPTGPDNEPNQRAIQLE